jgi:glycolate oxidase FAD binding subunit
MTATSYAAALEAVASVCEVAEAGPADGVDAVPAALVARPRSTEQVSAVLRAAAAYHLSVVPRGRGTKMTWGMPPASAHLVLDVSALDQVLDHAAGDLIVATQAGARLSDVQSAVAEARQRLALDETVAGASIGGTLATNASGSHRLGAGSARDLLIGITVVRADGVVAKAGGRVVKNVAGYDLGKLLIGSFGTLAVITEATFRLHPLPAVQRWVSVPVGDPAEAQRLVQAAVHAQAVPAAIDVEWTTQAGAVHVLLEGRPDGVSGRTASVRGILGETSTASEAPPADGATYPWDTDATGDDRATALKLTFALSGLHDVLTVVREVGGVFRGSAGTGVAYAAIASGTPLGDVRTAVERLRSACTRQGGAAVVLDAPAAVKQAVDPWGPVAAVDLMRRVKDQFDPDHRLAPGRFVGGI